MGSLQLRRRVFQYAAGEEQVLDPDGTKPLRARMADGQKNGQHQSNRRTVTSPLGKQSHQALVLLGIGVVVSPVMKSRADRHCHHRKQVRHQQRNDGAPKSETLEAKEP